MMENICFYLRDDEQTEQEIVPAACRRGKKRRHGGGGKNHPRGWKKGTRKNEKDRRGGGTKKVGQRGRGRPVEKREVLKGGGRQLGIFRPGEKTDVCGRVGPSEQGKELAMGGTSCEKELEGKRRGSRRCTRGGRDFPGKKGGM